MTGCPDNCTCSNETCGGTTKYAITGANSGYLVNGDKCELDSVFELVYDPSNSYPSNSYMCNFDKNGDPTSYDAFLINSTIGGQRAYFRIVNAPDWSYNSVINNMANISSVFCSSNDEPCDYNGRPFNWRIRLNGGKPVDALTDYGTKCRRGVVTLYQEGTGKTLNLSISQDAYDCPTGYKILDESRVCYQAGSLRIMSIDFDGDSGNTFQGCNGYSSSCVVTLTESGGFTLLVESKGVTPTGEEVNVPIKINGTSVNDGKTVIVGNNTEITVGSYEGLIALHMRPLENGFSSVQIGNGAQTVYVQIERNVNTCTPMVSETPDASTCKTTSYSCADGCGGTRTCYKYACGDKQTCENGTCVDVIKTYCTTDNDCSNGERCRGIGVSTGQKVCTCEGEGECASGYVCREAGDEISGVSYYRCIEASTVECGVYSDQGYIPKSKCSGTTKCITQVCKASGYGDYTNCTSYPKKVVNGTACYKSGGYLHYKRPHACWSNVTRYTALDGTYYYIAKTGGGVSSSCEAISFIHNSSCDEFSSSYTSSEVGASLRNRYDDTKQWTSKLISYSKSSSRPVDATGYCWSYRVCKSAFVNGCKDK